MILEKKNTIKNLNALAWLEHFVIYVSIKIGVRFIVRKTIIMIEKETLLLD